MITTKSEFERLSCSRACFRLRANNLTNQMVNNVNVILGGIRASVKSKPLL